MLIFCGERPSHARPELALQIILGCSGNILQPPGKLRKKPILDVQYGNVETQIEHV
jgi:hypothetical protein